jgi:hypothetical protein
VVFFELPIWTHEFQYGAVYLMMRDRNTSEPKWFPFGTKNNLLDTMNAIKDMSLK